MEKREFKSKRRYLASFLIATFLFIAIILISYSFSYVELRRISNLQGDVAYGIFEDKLDYTLFERGICNEESFDKVSRDLNFQGRIIDDLEKKFGKDDEAVLFRKKFYSLVELEHFEFIKLLNERCNLDMSTILFFYSNEDEDLGRSEEVGRLLDTVYTRNSNSVLIYSFDVNLESELIDKLKTKYNVKDSPSVVVNEGSVIVNPLNLDDIEPHLSVKSEGTNVSEVIAPTIYLN